MREKRIFLLSGGQLVAHHWQGGRFSGEFVFRADEEGLATFAEYLRNAPSDPVGLLVDVVEEEFREESVPHVMGADRRAVIRNKKTRLFRDPTYSYAVVQGREATGRRDDKVLMSALIRPDMLAPWLGQMARMKVPLAGIYSLALLSELLLKRLKITSPAALLVTQQSSGGLRQSFLLDQRLKVSRLAVAPEFDSTRYPAYILGEVEKIRRYLGSLRQLPRDTPLDVYIVSQGVTLESLRRQASDTVTTRHHFLDAPEVAHRLGIKRMAPTPYADLLFAHLLAKESPPNHYAPERETRYFSLQRARSGMIAASAVLLLVGLGWAGSKLFDVIATRQDTFMISQQVNFYGERVRFARENLPAAPALAHDVQMAVETADRLRSYKASPLKLMSVLSQGLESFPDLYIDDIEWAVGPDADVRIGGRGGDRARARDISQGLVADPAESGEQYHIAHVKGHLDPFDGDYRAALSAVNRFAEAISRIESVERVQALALPLNTSSAQRLLGTAGAGSATGSANFELRIVLKTRDAQPS